MTEFPERIIARRTQRMAQILQPGEQLRQVGTMGFRNEDGTIGDVVPIYQIIGEMDVNPRTGLTPEEERAAEEAGEALAHGFKQYVDGLEKHGIDPDSILNPKPPTNPGSRSEPKPLRQTKAWQGCTTLANRSVMRYRCCMCPNIGTSVDTCKDGEPCRFVVGWKDRRHRRYTVQQDARGRGCKAFVHRPDSDTARPMKSLPWRESFDEAQQDLNTHAMANEFRVFALSTENEEMERQ